MAAEDTSAPVVLVVDDQLINIRLLERKLEQNGIRVLGATNGVDGLRLAHAAKPHVVLLDIMMPGMDGLEVCRRLKDAPETCAIPVIFITARSSREGKLEGLYQGAADYLVKPVDLDEMLARVRTQIRIVDSHQQNLELLRRLEAARRQTSMMHLTEGIAHNLNNLLGIVIGYLSIIRMQPEQAQRVVSSCNKMEEALTRMAKIVHELTIIGQFSSAQIVACPFNRVVEMALLKLRQVFPAGIAVEVDLPAEITLETNPDLLADALARLLLNAWESYQRLNKPAEERWIGLRARQTGGQTPQLRIEVVDRGAGIAEEIRDHVFDPFVSTEANVGRGMGLTIARHSVRNLGGDIELLPNPQGGTRAVVTHPLGENTEMLKC
jgi:DNA-binding response OmpR family regulator